MDYEDEQEVLEPELETPAPPEPPPQRVAQADTGVRSDAQPVAATTPAPTPTPTPAPTPPAPAPPAEKKWTLYDDSEEAPAKKWFLYTEPDETPFGAFSREALHGAPAAVVGAITGGYAAGVGGTLVGGPVGTAVGAIGGGLIGGFAGGYATEKVKDAALHALGRDDNAIRAANAEEHPWASAAGRGVSNLAGFGAGLKKGAVSMAGRLFGAGTSGAIETGAQVAQGKSFKEAIPPVAASTAAGFVFAHPYAPGRAAQAAGKRHGEVFFPPPAPPPPPPRTGVDQPGVKTSDWTGPPGEVGPHVPPEQGQLPFGQGAAARPPEPPQVRYTPRDAMRKEELALKAKFRGSNLTREEQAEYAALEQKEAAAARPQRPQIGGGEAQPELPFPPPPPPPRTGYSQQPELPLEPPPVINAEGQYGFAINAPHPGNQYQHTPPPMPAGAGTAREAAPPPRLKEPDPAPHSAVRRGLFSETPPDAAAGIHVLQPGQVDSTVRHGLAARNVEPRQPPQRYSFEPRRPPAPPPPAPDTSPLPRNQSLAIRPAETTQGTTEPPVPPGHTRMYQGANQPEKQFSPDRSVAARYGAVQFVDVDNRLGKPFFTPMQMGSPEYISRNPIYRQRLRPVQEMRTGTGQPPEPPTGGSSPPPPPPTPPSSGGPRMSDPNLDAQISQAIGPQPPVAPAPTAPTTQMALLRTKANPKGEQVRLVGEPRANAQGTVYQRISNKKGVVQAVPVSMLHPVPPPKVAKPAPAAAAQTEAKSQQMAREGPKQFPKEPTPEMSPHAREVMEIANQIEATGLPDAAGFANSMRGAAHGGIVKPDSIPFYREKLAAMQARVGGAGGKAKPSEGYTIMDILEAKPLADLEARINDRGTPAATQLSDLLQAAATRVEQLGKHINDAGWLIGDVHGASLNIPSEVRQAKKLISEIAGTVSATLSGAKARKGADHVHKTAQNMQRLRALLGEAGAPAPPPAPKPKETPSLAGMAKPKDESKFTPAEQEELRHSKTIENAIDRIEEAGEAGDRTALAKAAADAREVLKATPDHIKQSDPEYWGQFDGADGVIARMEAPGYKFTPAVVDATPPKAVTPKETIAARPAGETVGDALKKKAAPKADETVEPLAPEGTPTPKSFWSTKVDEPTPKVTDLPKGTFKGTQLEFEGLSPGMRREVKRTAEKEAPKAEDSATSLGSLQSKPAESLFTPTSGKRPAIDFIGPLKDDITASHYAHRMAEMRSHKPRPVNKMWRNPDAADPKQVALQEARIKVWEKEYRAVSANQKLALARDNAAFQAKQGAAPADKPTLRERIAAAREKEPATTGSEERIKRALDEPVSKHATLEVKPDEQGKGYVVTADGGAVSWHPTILEAHAAERAIGAARLKQPLRRDVIERGPGGRPTKTAPLKIGAEEKILEKGFARTVSGMQEASRMQGARQTTERPSRPDNMNVPAHRRSTEYGLAVRDQQYGSIKGKAGDYDYWRAIAVEEGHTWGSRGRPSPYTAARAHSQDGKTTVVIGHDGRRTIYRDGERIHRDRVNDPIPAYLIEQPARRSTVEAAARKHGGLEPATEALVKRIQQRVDDIKAGRAAPGSGKVERHAIRRSDVDKSRAKVAGAAKVAPQIKTMNGVVFTGATVHEAALKAINGGFRPNQLYTMTGTPYTPPPAAPTAAPARPPQVAAAAAPSAGAAGPPAGGGPPPGGTTPAAPPPQPAGSVAAAEKSILSHVAAKPAWYSSVPTSLAEAKVKWRQFYTAHKNEMDPFDQARKLEKGTIPVEEEFAMLARLTKGLGGRFQVMMKHGTYDLNTGKINGKGLDEVIKPIADNPNGFTAYALSKRVIELEGRNIRTGMSLADAHTVVAANAAKFEPVFRDLVAFQDRVLENLVRSGVLSDAQANAMRAMNKEYVPFYRMLDPKSELGAQLGSGLQTKNPIFRIKGHDSDVFDPIDSIIKNTYVFTDLAHRNQVMVAMKKFNDRLPPDKRFMELDKSVRPIEVSTGELQGWMKKHGIAGIADETLTIFRPKPFQPAPDKIRLYENGKSRIYTVPEEIGAAVNAMDRDSFGLFTKIMSTPAKLLRTGVVLAPEFMLRNPGRDAIMAFVQAKHGSIPVYDFARGLKHIFQKSEHYQEWLISGGANANLVSMDRALLHIDPRSLSSQLANVVVNPKQWLKMLQHISELSENATRVGMHVRATGKGVHRLEAAYAAREGTLDFSRVGAAGYMKSLNSMIPFLNVHLEGLDRTARAFRDNPIGTTAKMLASITLPSVALWFRNKDDERVQQLPAWQRDLFWIVTTNDWQPLSAEDRARFPEDLKGLSNTVRRGPGGGWEVNNGTIYRIPKPFEPGLLFGSIPERILDHYFKQNPEAFRNLSKSALRAIVPNYIPQAALPAMEHWANRSLFLDRNLLTEKQEKLPPELQFGPHTTETSKVIGSVIRSVAGEKSSFGSPIVIDNYIRQWTGGLGSHVASMIDAGIKTQQDRAPEPTRTWADIPGVKAFVARHPSSGAEAIQHFYDERSSRRMDAAGVKELLRTDPARGQARLLQTSPFTGEPTAKALKASRDAVTRIMADRDMSPDDKRSALDLTYLLMVEQAKRGLEAFKETKRRPETVQ